jgi:hypothetical protein
MAKKEAASLMQYAGWAAQVMAALALGVYAGFKLDKWIAFAIPICIWLLPLLILIGLLLKVVKDTSKK